MNRFLFFILYIIVFQLQAQNEPFTIAKSEIFKGEKYETSLLFAKEDTNGDIYVVRNFWSSYSNPKGYYIEHYNKDLALLKRTTIDINRNELKGIYINETSIILLQFQYRQKEKQYAFVALTSLKEEFNFIEKEIFSIERDRLYKYDHFGIREEPEFNIHRNNNLAEIVQSNNREYLAINIVTKQEDTDAMLVVVFDKNFDKLFEQTFNKINGNADIEKSQKVPLVFQNMIVDDKDGTVHLLGKLYKSNSMEFEKDDKPNFIYVLFKAGPTVNAQKTITDNVENFIHSMRLVTNGEQISAVGYYCVNSDLWKFGSSIFLGPSQRFDGVVRYEIDSAQMYVNNESFMPFSEQFMIDKYGKRKDKIDAFVAYRTIFMDGDGNIILNGEEFFITVSDNNMQSKKNYEDIITCSISSNGELVWARNINKKQASWSTDNIPFFSYLSFLKNKRSIYLVNASDPLKVKNNNTVVFGEGEQIYFISISEDGTIEHKQLLNSEFLGSKLKLRFGIPINDSDILIEAENDKDPLLYKLHFN